MQLYRKILARELRALPETGVSVGREASIDTIAVLPFHNDTGDSSLTYLSSGIAESLIKNLSRLPRLRVLAYSTVARYKGRDLNPRKLGRSLMVKALAAGRLVKVEGALVIVAELVDTSDGTILWGEQYRPRQIDVLEVQEEMSQKISDKLKLQLTVDERKRLVKQYTADPEAYTSYLKGRFYWNKRTSEGLKKAIDHFQQAIDKDPSYALAYSGLADCYNLLSLYGVMAPKKAMPQAKAAARKALKIDESLAEAHTSIAYTYLYFDWNWPAAESEFQRAIELNPNYATAHHWYHEYLIAMGRFDEQMAEILRAEELDPVSLIINTDVGWGLYYARRFDQAIEQLRRTLELDANFGIAHLMLGLAYAQKRCLGEALSSIQRSIELSAGQPFTLALGALGYVYAISGRSSEALSAIDRMNELSGARYASDYCQALVLAGLGDRTGALNRLERAFDQRYDRLIYLNVEPVFDGVRNDPRFKSLIRRIGLGLSEQSAARP
jgi:TolB-like protein/Tfp pilus assembly protein PilF